MCKTAILLKEMAYFLVYQANQLTEQVALKVGASLAPDRFS